MPFNQDARRASAQIAEQRAKREWNKLIDTINGLVEDMADVKKRLARLEKNSGQSSKAEARRRQSDSGE